jgi:hypothetical protein
VTTGAGNDRASDHADERADERVPRGARVFVGVFLAVLAVFGFGHFEAWPLTSFHLFSAARESHENRWVATTVDHAGHETPLEQQDLPLGYRLAEWPLQRFPTSSRATQIAVCKGIAKGARGAGRDVASVRVYKVGESIARDGNHWVVTKQPRLYTTCNAAELGT